MPDARLRLCRSLLFLPASNPRAIAKARELDADMIIFDLEDAVRPEDKGAARAAAVAAVREGFGERLTAIRLNHHASPWHADDLEAVAASHADFIVVPKVERSEDVSAAGKPVLAMIETAGGVLAAAAIAPATAGLIAGTNDLAADLAIPDGAGRAGLALALQTIVLAARAAKVAAFDGVYNKLADDDGLAEQCCEGRGFGFDGKSVIHPDQIATVNRIFGPGDEALEDARRLVAAAQGGAERFEGRMIEGMHVAAAKALLAREGR